MAGEAVKVPFIEAAAPSTPAASRVVIYAKSDGLMYSKDDAGAETLMSSGGSGSVATDAIWDAAGDLAVGSGANTAAKLSIGATNGMALQRVSGAVAWALPPGFELDYAQITSPVTVTATSEGAADTVITGTSQAYAAEPVLLTFFTPFLQNGAFTTFCIVYLYDVATSTVVGRLNRTDVINGDGTALFAQYRFTPTAATHQYRVRAYIDAGTQANINAGSGGSAAYLPAFLRIVKV